MYSENQGGSSLQLTRNSRRPATVRAVSHSVEAWTAAARMYQRRTSRQSAFSFSAVRKVPFLNNEDQTTIKSKKSRSVQRERHLRKHSFPLLANHERTPFKTSSQHGSPRAPTKKLGRYQEEEATPDYIQSNTSISSLNTASTSDKGLDTDIPVLMPRRNSAHSTNSQCVSWIPRGPTKVSEESEEPQSTKDDLELLPKRTVLAFNSPSPTPEGRLQLKRDILSTLKTSARSPEWNTASSPEQALISRENRVNTPRIRVQKQSDSPNAKAKFANVNSRSESMEAIKTAKSVDPDDVKEDTRRLIIARKHSKDAPDKIGVEDGSVWEEYFSVETGNRMYMNKVTGEVSKEAKGTQASSLQVLKNILNSDTLDEVSMPQNLFIEALKIMKTAMNRNHRILPSSPPKKVYDSSRLNPEEIVTKNLERAVEIAWNVFVEGEKLQERKSRLLLANLLNTSLPTLFPSQKTRKSSIQPRDQIAFLLGARGAQRVFLKTGSINKEASHFQKRARGDIRRIRAARELAEKNKTDMNSLIFLKGHELMYPTHFSTLPLPSGRFSAKVRCTLKIEKFELTSNGAFVSSASASSLSLEMNLGPMDSAADLIQRAAHKLIANLRNSPTQPITPLWKTPSTDFPRVRGSRTASASQTRSARAGSKRSIIDDYYDDDVSYAEEATEGFTGEEDDGDADHEFVSTIEPSYRNRTKTESIIEDSNFNRIGLKALGMEEYILGTTILLNSRYVRESIRDDKKPVFVLKELTSKSYEDKNMWLARPSIEDKNDNILGNQIRNPVTGLRRLLSCPSSKCIRNRHAMKVWPSSDCHIPFYVDVKGVTCSRAPLSVPPSPSTQSQCGQSSVGMLKFPRLMADDNKSRGRHSQVFVRVSIIFGDQKLTFDDQTKSVWDRLQWEQRLCGDRGNRKKVTCLISDFPLNSKIAVQIRQRTFNKGTSGLSGTNAAPVSTNGSVNSSKAKASASIQDAPSPTHADSILLAWVIVPLFHPDGAIRQGDQLLPLWIEGISSSSISERDSNDDWIFSAPCVNPDSQVPEQGTQSYGMHVGDSQLHVYAHLRLPAFAVDVAINGDKLDTLDPNIAVARAMSAAASLRLQDQKIRARLNNFKAQGLPGELLPEDVDFLWTIRYRLSMEASLLPIFARCVRWEDPRQASEARGLLRVWNPPHSLSVSLQLLHYTYAEKSVRDLAVEWLRTGCGRTDGKVGLEMYLLQLIQSLKHEVHYYNPLVRLLIAESLKRPVEFAHQLFWHTRAEMEFSHPAHIERYALLLQEVLMSIPKTVRTDLEKSLILVKGLEKVARIAKEKGQIGRAYGEVASHLTELNTTLFEQEPNGVQLPLDPRLRVQSLRVEKCKVLSSKMKPLWLVFRSIDTSASDVLVIFKDGDDLRQDMLMLQTLALLDNLWLEAGLDMRLTTYRVMATGCGSSPSDNTSNLATSRTPDKQAVVDGRNTPNSRKPQPRSKERATESSFVGDFEQKEVDDNFDDSTATGIYEKAARAFGAGRGVGMIQAVPHSATTSAIQVSEGGGALGAFSPKVIERFLKRHNRSTSERIKARDNFARSCAGYCVATFILGVGDRHSGNIMCSKDGKLFHIDFGHILGNFKSKYGFRRERTPFVFTPEMAYVLEQIESERLQFKSKSISQNRGRDLKLAHTQRGEGGNSGSSVSDFASMETSESRKIVKKANGYKRFLELAKDAFMVVRRNSAFIESLFSLMVSAGLPELSDIKSIKYLSDQLFSGMDEREAGSKLERMIKQARNDTYRRVDNYIHAVKHKQPSSGTSASAGGARFSRRIKSKNNESQ